MALDWPLGLYPRSAAFGARGRIVSGPPSLTGRSQVDAVDAGYWTAMLRGFPVHKANQRLWRALIARLEAGAAEIRVPVFELAQPWPLGPDGEPVTETADVMFDDGASFDDGVGFWQPVIAAVTVGAAALRATSLTIDFLYAGEVTGGEYFSAGDRLHVIRSIMAESGTQKTVTIWPPLREAVAAGTELNFDAPVCRMRLADEAAGDLDMEFGIVAFPDLSFVEVV
jgi:hypothetical protein